MNVDMLEVQEENVHQQELYNDYHNIHYVIDRLNNKNFYHNMKYLLNIKRNFLIFKLININTYIDIDFLFVHIVQLINMD